MTGHDEVPFDNRASNPNSTGPDGLTGDLGVSSERTETAGGRSEPTDGTRDTTPTEWDAVDVSQRDLHPDPEPEQDGEPRPEPIADEKLRRDGT